MRCPPSHNPFDLNTAEGLEQSRLRRQAYTAERREIKEACLGVLRSETAIAVKNGRMTLAEAWALRRREASRIIWSVIQNPSPALGTAKLKWFISCYPGKRTTDARNVYLPLGLNEEWRLRCLEADEMYVFRGFWRRAAEMDEEQSV